MVVHLVLGEQIASFQ